MVALALMGVLFQPPANHEALPWIQLVFDTLGALRPFFLSFRQACVASALAPCSAAHSRQTLLDVLAMATEGEKSVEHYCTVMLTDPELVT